MCAIVFRSKQQTANSGRAGIAFKTLIPHHFLLDAYALYADADEFLILPEGVLSVAAVVDRMEQSNTLAVVGPLIEFFPRRLPAARSSPTPPENFEQLLAESPYFETAPLVEPDPVTVFRKTGRTKSELLFEHFDVRRSWGILGLSRRPTSPRFKTPILRHGPGAFRLGSHKASVPASSEIMLPMAHFVFTANFVSKIERAMALKSHAGRSAKYFYYRDLIEKISLAGDDLVGPKSQEFRSAQDLIVCGHMKWRS